MGAYAFKLVLALLPKSYTGEGFEKRYGFPCESSADYDGDLWIAAADYIQDLRQRLEAAEHALRFYADPVTYELDDCNGYYPDAEVPIFVDSGKFAREALAALKEDKP